MKKNEKIMITILIVIVVIVGGILIIRNVNQKESEPQPQEEVENIVAEENVQTLGDGTKLNISTKLKESKKLGDLEIGDIQLTNKNGQSVLLANIVNKGKQKTDVILIDIVLYDKNNQEIATIPGIISPLEVGESTQLNTVVQEDYANAYDFKIVKK